MWVLGTAPVAGAGGADAHGCALRALCHDRLAKPALPSSVLSTELSFLGGKSALRVGTWMETWVATSAAGAKLLPEVLAAAAWLAFSSLAWQWKVRVMASSGLGSLACPLDAAAPLFELAPPAALLQHPAGCEPSRL